MANKKREKVEEVEKEQKIKKKRIKEIKEKWRKNVKNNITKKEKRSAIPIDFYITYIILHPQYLDLSPHPNPAHV